MKYLIYSSTNFQQILISIHVSISCFFAVAVAVPTVSWSLICANVCVRQNDRHASLEEDLDSDLDVVKSFNMPGILPGCSSP